MGPTVLGATRERNPRIGDSPVIGLLHPRYEVSNWTEQNAGNRAMNTPSELSMRATIDVRQEDLCHVEPHVEGRRS